MSETLRLRVNGTTRSVQAEADTPLLTVLRDELDLTGTKYGCGEGQCGACTVLIDGQPRRSCITSVGSLEGKEVLTIEGLARNGRLHPVQQAFLDEDVMQCGYCTPGMILSAVGLLRRNPNPSDQEIRRALEGNICRCGTYSRILRAVRRASQTMKGGSR